MSDKFPLCKYNQSIEIFHLDGRIEKYENINGFISSIGYVINFKDDSCMIISPSVINKLRVIYNENLDGEFIS